ncbi:MAG TPA: AAA-like domain-containing protein [Verrucomicrobiae bacterium]|nr:AAA-like domain-containing protein [Verrucomicrobiae bacterium]
MPEIRGDFYVTGGTLRHDAPSYVERRADRDLCEGLLQGEFCYVLTSRQMGKSSLMVRTVKRLREERVAVAVLDLTAIGQNLTLEQWYDGLISRMGQQFDLEDELLDFCEQHPEWGALQRWITSIEQVVLRKLSGKVVIFVDEIDIVRSLQFSTDEFFAAIREFYNRRSREESYNRLGFCLLGVATPTDLIRDTRMTPFNIGRRIELNDFTAQEARPLARGLTANAAVAGALLERVLYWTGGHPYLTQRLCRELANALVAPQAEPESGPPIPPLLPNFRTVDLLAEKLFLTRQARDRDDNLIFVRERILRSEGDVAGLLYLYRRIHNGQMVPDDETNPLVSVLMLSGITRGLNGYLQVRNRIYWRVFDGAWIQTSMPAAEVRRQRRAGRYGVLIGFGAAATLVLAYLVLGPLLSHYRQANLALRTTRSVESAYRQVRSYRDTFETTVELGLGGTTVPFSGSGSLIFEKPDRVNLSLKSSMTWPEVELRLMGGTNHAVLSNPALGEFQVLDTPRATAFDLPADIAQQVGPIRLFPVYRLLLGPEPDGSVVSGARNPRYAGSTQINGQPANIITWEHDPASFLKMVGLTNDPSDHVFIPVVAWVNASNYMILRVQLDLSRWASQIMGSVADLPVTGLLLTESHRVIRTDTVPASEARFKFQPGEGEHRVDRLTLPPPNFASWSSKKRLFSRFIPPRLRQTPPECIDLGEYYNAALVQTWHPGMPNNSLDMLPPGALELAGSIFDVRGIIQLSGADLRKGGGRYPEQINGIPVGLKCRQIQFLHAAGWRSPDGTRIGAYIMHYADEHELEIPIVYGEDVRDWNGSNDRSTEVTHGDLVWSGINNAGLHVRLFKTTWVNPFPEKEIVSMDYHSAMAAAAPFLIAVTAEP